MSLSVRVLVSLDCWLGSAYPDTTIPSRVVVGGRAFDCSIDWLMYRLPHIYFIDHCSQEGPSRGHQMHQMDIRGIQNGNVR